MQYLKKDKNPPDSLQKKKECFFNDCGNSDLWDFYRNNKSKYDYRTSEVKRLLLLASNNRCAICSRSIYDPITLEDQNVPNAFTIEHIVPKQKNPELIFDWDNMIPCCSACNGARNNKEYINELYINPCERKDCGSLFSFSFDGCVFCDDQKFAKQVNYMISLYNLNGDSRRQSLRSERKWFYKMLISKYYQEMVQLNEEFGLSDNIIVFTDMFMFFKRYI